jgi:hypothetical protein
MRIIYSAFALFALAACAQPTPLPIQAMSPEQADCFSRAKAGGSGIGGNSIVWQMAIQNENERLVYESCMHAKGLTPQGTPVNAHTGQGILGMTFRAHTEGLEVVSIDPTSEAARKGIRQHDVFTRLGSYKLSSPEAFASLIATMRKKEYSRAGFRIKQPSGYLLFIALHI